MLLIYRLDPTSDGSRMCKIFRHFPKPPFQPARLGYQRYAKSRSPLPPAGGGAMRKVRFMGGSGAGCRNRTRDLPFSPQRQSPPENWWRRRWEHPVFSAARCRAVDTALFFDLAACPMLTDACARALSSLWEAAFDLRGARVRAHPGAGSIARARGARARCGNARSAMRGNCASLAEWGERSRGK